MPSQALWQTGAVIGVAMRYVTDDFVAAHGWTPDKTAKALMEPLPASAYSSNEPAVLERGLSVS